MRVFVTGGTGLVGTRLVAALRARGDQAIVLSRNKAAAERRLDRQAQVVEGDPTEAGEWMKAVGGCDGVVNLAGENLFARRWNADFKERLRESRLRATRHVVQAISAAVNKPSVLVSGSAIGYYGPHGDEELTEDSPPGGDFLAQLCVEWESAAAAVPHGVRVVRLRTGVVLDRAGGALKQMMLPFKLFAGGKVGSGKQWLSWIHHADEVGLILFALDTRELAGPLNLTAPQPTTNADFAKALGKAMRRPSFMPTPAFALRAALGEVAELVTQGQRVLPKRAQEQGYRFQFSALEAALADLFP